MRSGAAVLALERLSGVPPMGGKSASTTEGGSAGFVALSRALPALARGVAAPCPCRWPALRERFSRSCGRDVLSTQSFFSPWASSTALADEARQNAKHCVDEASVDYPRRRAQVACADEVPPTCISGTLRSAEKAVTSCDLG